MSQVHSVPASAAGYGFFTKPLPAESLVGNNLSLFLAPLPLRGTLLVIWADEVAPLSITKSACALTSDLRPPLLHYHGRRAARSESPNLGRPHQPPPGVRGCVDGLV